MFRGQTVEFQKEYKKRIDKLRGLSGLNGMIQMGTWNKYYTYPTKHQLRNLMLYHEYNGFGDCYVRVGRYVYVDENKFFEWAKTKDKFKDLGENRERYRVIDEYEENKTIQLKEKAQEKLEKIKNMQELRRHFLEAATNIGIQINDMMQL